MSERLVPRPTPATSTVSVAGSVDPTAEALRRLRMLCVFITLAPPVKLAFNAAFTPAGSPHKEILGAATVIFGVGMVGAALVYGLLGNERIPRQRRLDIGFGFQVFLALLVSLFRHLSPWSLGDGFRDFSPVTMVTLVFAALIPNPPRRTLAAGLAAAAMDPLGLAVSVLVWGNAPPPLLQAFGIVVPTFGSAVVSSVISRVIYGLAKKVDEARKLGSYRLVEKLGKGGMGEVWRAEHEMLARPAAIKLVRPDTALDSPALARFEREAQATAALTSPHTIDLYDFGVAEDGTFYYVMELLDGLDLEALVDRHGPMPAERVVHLLRQVCDSLDEAHHRGLVHRDIKPANIYVCRYGRHVDFVKVLDFGLVKATSPLTQADQGAAVTVQGTIAGTPAFVAPEIVLGEVEVDARVDIYAVGCVAYWLLTGLFVFEASSPMKMMLHHAHSAPAPPSSRTEIPVPAALERLVLDCLEKDPARRPASAEELASRLDAIELERPWSRERANRWWNIHSGRDSSVAPAAPAA